MSVLKAALLGKELSHSLSPSLHRELAKILSPKFGSHFEECIYDLVECPEECDFAQWIKTAPTNGYRGANVTYPYKEKAFTLSDRHVGVSSFIDSANTLVFSEDEIRCTSTDGAGFLNALMRQHPTFSLERYHLVMVGAGEAARAVVYSLCTTWMPQSLTIVNRSMANAEELAEFCIAQAPGPTVRAMGINEFIHDSPEAKYRLIIQCTPVGQDDHPGDLLTGFAWHESDFAIDLIYNPLRTAFLQAASHAGAKTMNGLGMLIEQAALSQAFWMTEQIPGGSPLSDSEFEMLKNFLTKTLSS
ncbi:MAG: shikimate dehydrogenase [Bacteroidota bacterium]|nr:shikimate dehydrogenase [Bacteroidota bacterium]MDP4229318.1 shikimate dehydrogenase [Bacteroidota bacterium]MDP4237124.1 shikimate dehydrogenase [Bacteroidota bacterium]